MILRTGKQEERAVETVRCDDGEVGLGYIPVHLHLSGAPGTVEPPRPTSPSGSSRRSYMMLVPLSHMSSHQITINSSPFVIGRDQDSDFCIPDNYVSGRHLVIDYYEGEGLCYATDVSTYGSYLNSVRMPTNTPQPLHQSDTLQIAGLMFRVEYVHF